MGSQLPRPHSRAISLPQTQHQRGSSALKQAGQGPAGPHKAKPLRVPLSSWGTASAAWPQMQPHAVCSPWPCPIGAPPPRTPALSALPVPPSPWRELKPKGRKGPARSPRPTSRQHKLLDFTQLQKQRQDRKPPSPGSRAQPLPPRPHSPQTPSLPSGCPGGSTQAPTALTSILTPNFQQPHSTQPPTHPPQAGQPPQGRHTPVGQRQP